jgi:hypothetical protein
MNVCYLYLFLALTFFLSFVMAMFSSSGFYSTFLTLEAFDQFEDSLSL